MPRIIASAVFSDTELHIINCCRIYLNGITVSDLLTACGTLMDPAAQAHETPSASTSKYHKTLQARPHSWLLWDRAMSVWFDKSGKLYNPLGPWLHSGSRLRRAWQAYYDGADDTVYGRTVDGFVHYSPASHGYTPTEITEWTPTATSTPVQLTPRTATHYCICLLYTSPSPRD